MTSVEPGSEPAAPPRRRRWRIVAWALLAVLLVVVGSVVRFLVVTGTFRRVHPHFAGRCRLIEGPVGPEDITIDQGSGRAYISASDRRALMAGRPVPGAIWSYDLTVADSLPVNLTRGAGVEFQPHGISLWSDPDGAQVLFVINHPAPLSGWPPNTVEIEDVRGGRLQHRATLSDPLLVMPNDLVAVGRDRFYLTNTHAHPPGARQTLETFLRLRSGNVLAYGPGGFRIAARRLIFPNGINVSPDGRTVYVAEMTWRTVQLFARDPQTDALSLRDQIRLDSDGDNIEVDPDGTLWIGSHPKLLAVARTASDPSVHAPAQILRVAAGSREVEEVYLSTDERLGAASVGAHYGNRLLIGQIFGDGFLDCTLP